MGYIEVRGMNSISIDNYSVIILYDCVSVNHQDKVHLFSQSPTDTSSGGPNVHKRTHTHVSMGTGHERQLENQKP